MDKVTVTYNGQEIQVDQSIADYLETERKRAQAEKKRDARHLSDKEIGRNDIDDFLSDKPDDFVDRMICESEEACLQQALESLTETQRRRVRMYFFDVFTYRQIAEFENANEKSIRESIGAAIKKLKSFFE